MRIALIGADGQLGTDLNRVLQERHEVHPLQYPEFDITVFGKTRLRLKEIAADAVINTAAYNRVDAAENEPSSAFELNTLAVRNLAEICRDQEAVLVHFSSDYVFSGDKTSPYHEEDLPGPRSVYGVSKLAGEFFTAALAPRHMVIRTCGLYGTAGCWGKGTNFVDAVIKRARRGESLRIVNDQHVTPTATHELAAAVEDVIEHGAFGLYHLTNEGQCTWYEFAGEIFRVLGMQPEMTPIGSLELKAAAKRPAYSVLDNKKTRDEGLPPMSPWKKALREYLERKGYLAGSTDG